MIEPDTARWRRPAIGRRTGDRRAVARLSSLWRRRDFAEVRYFVMFIGCPRSGHSLLGSLLDAHPDAVVAHELDALKYVEAGWARLELFDRILRQDRDFTASGRGWSGYDYTVPGQWQGRFRRLRVIGDKRGAVTAERLGSQPELLEHVQDLVRVPVRFVHVVRNPFDNIATMARHEGDLEKAVERYFAICDSVADVRRRFPGSVLDMAHEDLVADVPGRLAAVCEWFGLDPSPDYLSACAGVVFDSPRRTRGDLVWPQDLVDRIRASVESHDFLPYALEELP